MKLSVISIATNGYTHYWLKMVKSFLDNINSINEVEFHILTDDIAFIKINLPAHQNAHFFLHEISGEPWPMPTLLRYRYIDAIFDKLMYDTVMYVDADMLFHPSFDENFAEMVENGNINFVAHPGYWRSRDKQISGTFYQKFRLKLSDMIRKVSLGGLGAWECRPESLAYVPRKLRKTYVCGGVWFGSKPKIGILAKSLAMRTQTDLDNGLIAKWHDESHLNCWYVQNGGNILTPEYCYDPTYINLKNLIPRIEAVDKGEIKRV